MSKRNTLASKDYVGDTTATIEVPRQREAIKIIESNPDLVRILRDFGDVVFDCKISKGARELWKIDTGIKLLDKLIYLISHYSRFNIEMLVKYKSERPSYRIVEYSGRVLGEAFKILAKERVRKYGIHGHGYSQGIFKEAFSEARLSLKSGFGFWISRGSSLKIFGRVGELPEETIKLFFEEFARGINGTIHLDLVRSESPYNLWISAFIAFGEALGQTFAEDEWFKEESSMEEALA
ncbi:MAG: hypothetical protein NZ929_00700 [Aigarchaeota archaeon]|nr:hypothetical protein [Aigarchaeota archaeon]MDW7986352.1 hypothetical protein [Nitrososphaerota archaeon]